MQTQQISFQECDSQFAKIFERVANNHEIISVSNTANQKIVLLDAEEYNGLLETLYLLSNPINAERLQASISQHKHGFTREIDVTAYLD